MTQSIAELKGFDEIANPEYIPKEPIILPEQDPAFTYSLLHTIFNLGHRNEILLGSNQLVYHDVNVENEQMEGKNAWERFRANYDKYKNNLEQLLDKEVDITPQQIEADFPFPVFSLPFENQYKKMIIRDYPQVEEFSKKLNKMFSEEVLISNKIYQAIMEQIYFNCYVYAKGSLTQLVYFPLNEEEFNAFVEEQDYLITNVDKDLFSQQYNYVESQLLATLYHYRSAAPLRLLTNANGQHEFYYEKQLSINATEEIDTSDLLQITLGEYPAMRKYLNDFTQYIAQYYAYLNPFVVNNVEFEEDYFLQLNEEQIANLWVVAFSSMNSHLLLRLMRGKNTKNYDVIQHRDPMLMVAAVQLLNSNIHLATSVNSFWSETLIYYVDEWNETPMQSIDIFQDFLHKIKFYPNIIGIVKIMLNVVVGSKEERNMYQVPTSVIWKNIEDMQKIEIG